MCKLYYVYVGFVNCWVVCIKNLIIFLKNNDNVCLVGSV